MPTLTFPRERLAGLLAETVAAHLAEAGTAGGEAPGLEQTRNPEHGDLSTSVALRLARALRRPPVQIAEELADRLRARPEVSDLAEVSAVAGYVNFRFHPGRLVEHLPAIIARGDDYGRAEIGSGRPLQVEFVSVNPTGPMHVAHGRHAALGDSLARLLDFAGYAVSREFYINDAGRQVQLLGESILVRWLQQQGVEAEIPDGGYQGEYVADLARAAGARLGAELEAARGGGERAAVLAALAAFGTEATLAEIRRVLEQLDVRFDSWFSERSLYQDRWEEDTVARLSELGAVQRRDGAVWLVDPAVPDDEGDVIYKSSGDATYFLSDVLYHRDKLERRGFERAVVIWGAEHHAHVARLMRAVELLGLDPARLRIITLQHVHLKRGGEAVKMSKRAGSFELLSALVDEVGPDAARYFFVMRSPDSTMEFDIDLARSQSNENPVYYAQYASARLHNVLALAGERAHSDPGAADLSLLADATELDLVRHLLRWPQVVEQAATDFAPLALPYYAQELAQRIHVFYRNCKIVNTEPPLEAARLVLTRAALTTLKNALRLIGVSAPRRM
ncbi:MAG: arginine--tRNA ligase [Candidatus Dormibacteria bacterium]